MQKADNESSIQYFLRFCKQHKLNITPQRIAIYKELIGSKVHPSTDNIFRKIKSEFPSISFDTVNRTLLTFAEFGLVDIVESHSGIRRFDPNLNNHHHIHCIKCGEIKDFYNEDFDKIIIPQDVQSKYKVLNKKVILNVICKKCSNGN